MYEIYYKAIILSTGASDWQTLNQVKSVNTSRYCKSFISKHKFPGTKTVLDEDPSAFI